MKKRGKYCLDGLFKTAAASSVDILGYALLRPRKGGPVKTEAVKKILLLRLDHIGDVLMTTPAVRAVRKALPEAEIHMLVKESSADAVRGNSHLDQTLIFNAPWTIAGRDKATLREVIGTGKRLRRERYDCVLSFRADLREALLALATRARCRVGYGVRGGGFCFTHLAEYDPEVHDIRKNITMLQPLGVVAAGEEMEFHISAGDLRDADELIRERGLGVGAPCVGIHPGAASVYKRWSEEGFARLGDLLMQKGNRVVLLGSSDEEDLLGRVAGLMEGEPELVCGLRLKVLAALIGHLRFVVCNDTAPSHVAQAVGTTAVVLFGPTDENITGPLNREKHVVVRKDVVCRPCWRPGTTFRCAADLQCFRELSPDDVLRAILVFESEKGKRKR